MTPKTGRKIAYLICFVVISITVTGYFIGLQSPMNPSSNAGSSGDAAIVDEHVSLAGQATNGVIPATDYAGIGDTTRRMLHGRKTSLTDLKSTVDPMGEITVTPQQKAFALAMREQNRAFNGAPPTIPHAIDQMSSQACMVCHETGFRTESLRVPKMSHQFLQNCTQCHVEDNSRYFAATLTRDNSFEGLPAPNGGPRAYEGAPPMIPHSTWMRVDCLSCHGFAGQHGIRTTHPWRKNCQQCHAPSSGLNQVPLDSGGFLDPPRIDNTDP